MGGPGSGRRPGSGRSTAKKPTITLKRPGRDRTMWSKGKKYKSNRVNTTKEVNNYMKHKYK